MKKRRIPAMIPEKKVWKGVRAFLCCLSFLIAVPAGSSLAATAREIDVSVDVALEQFEKTVNGGRAFLDSAKGVLVFPSVVRRESGSAGNTARAPCGSAGRRRITTTPFPPPWAFSSGRR